MFEDFRRKTPFDKKTTIWLYQWMCDECDRLGLSISAIARDAIGKAIEEAIKAGVRGDEVPWITPAPTRRKPS